MPVLPRKRDRLGMNAFGKRNGLGGGSQRPQFGVARPMKSGPGAAAAKKAEDEAGGEQFPPVEDLENPSDDPGSEPRPNSAGPLGALDRLNERQNLSGEAASSKQEGFEASVHKIKEQVLPRL